MGSLLRVTPIAVVLRVDASDDPIDVPLGTNTRIDVWRVRNPRAKYQAIGGGMGAVAGFFVARAIHESKGQECVPYSEIPGVERCPVDYEGAGRGLQGTRDRLIAMALGVTVGAVTGAVVGRLIGRAPQAERWEAVVPAGLDGFLEAEGERFRAGIRLRH